VPVAAERKGGKDKGKSSGMFPLVSFVRHVTGRSEKEGTITVQIYEKEQSYIRHIRLPTYYMALCLLEEKKTLSRRNHSAVTADMYSASSGAVQQQLLPHLKSFDICISRKPLMRAPFDGNFIIEILMEK
jgi:hypothetical protein